MARVNDSRRSWGPVLGLTALALVIRFATLDARGFWLDEVITIRLIHGSLGDVVSRLDQFSIDQPPLYFVLAWGWAKLFGTSEVAMRSLPALCGALTVPVAYLAGAELRSRHTGLVAALLTTVSPLVIWHSQDARPYALMILLGGASFALFTRCLHDRRPRVLLAWVVVSTLAVAAHYVAGFLVAGEALWLLPARRWRVEVLAAVALLAVALLGLGAHATSGGSLGNGSWTQSYTQSSRLAQIPAQLLVGYQPPFQVVSAVAAAGLAAVMLIVLVVYAERSERAAATATIVVAGIGIGVPVLLSVAGHLSGLTTRYVVAAWVPLAVAGAVALTARRARGIGIGLGAAVCALFVAIGAGSAWHAKFDREDWRGAARALGDPRVRRIIVLSPSTGVLPLEQYLRHSHELRSPETAVREIVLLGLPRPYRKVGERPAPPRPTVVKPPAPGFAEAARWHGTLFTAVLFRSTAAREVTRRALVGDGLGESSPGVLVQAAQDR